MLTKYFLSKNIKTFIKRNNFNAKNSSKHHKYHYHHASPARDWLNTLTISLSFLHKYIWNARYQLISVLLFILNGFETIMSHTLVEFLLNLAVPKDVHHYHHAGFWYHKNLKNSLLVSFEKTWELMHTAMMESDSNIGCILLF